MKPDLMDVIRQGVYINGETLTILIVAILLATGLAIGMMVAKGVDKVDGRMD